MKKKTYDVLIIGGGIAGIYCAITLARGGKTVALVEKEKLGGTGLRWGALPVKKALDYFKTGKNYNLSHKWNRDIEDLENMINLKVQNENIDIYYGNGRFQKDRTFTISETLISSEYIVIATGTRPSSILDIPIDGHKIISHKEAIDFQNLPQDIIILGGNVEGVEFAAAFSQMGVKVTLIEQELSLLSGNDKDLVEPIENKLIKNGVKIIKGQGARESIVMGNKVKIILENGQEVEGEKVLVTFLRQGNFPKGIENLSIRTDENKIYVGENLETQERNVFAIGDINGKMTMAHVGINQGIQVAEHILYGDFINTNYDLLPRAVFTSPEMAGLGKQEWELDKGSYKVGYCHFKDTWRGWSKDIESGYIKLIVDLEDNIIGIWMVGENVSEYIGPLGILMNKGLKVRDIKSNLVINPSLMEAMLEATLKL